MRIHEVCVYGTAVQRKGCGSARITTLQHEHRGTNGVVQMSAGWKHVGAAPITDPEGSVGGMAGWRKETEQADFEVYWSHVWDGSWVLRDTRVAYS